MVHVNFICFVAQSGAVLGAMSRLCRVGKSLGEHTERPGGHRGVPGGWRAQGVPGGWGAQGVPGGRTRRLRWPGVPTNSSCSVAPAHRVLRVDAQALGHCEGRDRTGIPTPASSLHCLGAPGGSQLVLGAGSGVWGHWCPTEHPEHPVLPSACA